MDKQRFLNLCARNAGPVSEQRFEEWFNTISDHYGESHRRYHTREHVEHCLRQFDSARGCLEQPDMVEFAVWYHDAVYDTEGTDDELRSAHLFRDHATACMSAEVVQCVVDLIMVTVHSKEVPRTDDERYMVDIDLSSFGLPWPKFLADSMAVREEFSQLGDGDFYPSQERFLRSLLARPSFCLTRFFRDRHEQQARSNIERYLETLARQGKLQAEAPSSNS